MMPLMHWHRQVPVLTSPTLGFKTCFGKNNPHYLKWTHLLTRIQTPIQLWFGLKNWKFRDIHEPLGHMCMYSMSHWTWSNNVCLISISFGNVSTRFNCFTLPQFYHDAQEEGSRCHGRPSALQKPQKTITFYTICRCTMLFSVFFSPNNPNYCC